MAADDLVPHGMLPRYQQPWFLSHRKRVKGLEFPSLAGSVMAYELATQGYQEQWFGFDVLLLHPMRGRDRKS